MASAKKSDRRKSPKNKLDLGEKRSGLDRREDNEFRNEVEVHFRFYQGTFNKEVVEEIFVEELLPELSMVGIMDAQRLETLQDEEAFQRLKQVKMLNRLAYKFYECSFWHAKLDSDSYSLKGAISKLAKGDAGKLALKTQNQFANWMIKQRSWTPSQKAVIAIFAKAA